MKKTLKVDGMHCGGCSARLKRVLEALPQVEEAQADHETGLAEVTLREELSDSAIRSAVEAAGGFTVLEIR